MSTTNFNKVIPGLFIGDSASASSIDFLVDKNISHILICARELRPSFPKDFKYHKLGIQDTKRFDLSPYLEEALIFIKTTLDSGENVLVHCNLGISRSSSIVIAYLIAQCGMTYDKAFRHLKKSHPSACPNSGFETQLRLFESNHKALKKDSCMCLLM